ncbi:MAG: pirin family protein [Anaerolineae bacterium]|nr:pirin family protein [Gloeobacterales cyanobacterium ES-bin-313]
MCLLDQSCWYLYHPKYGFYTEKQIVHTNYSSFTPAAQAILSPATSEPRRIAYRTRGRQHGPIVRLVSPSDVGELIKPFVFLDHIDVDMASAPRFGFHPHSGIATLTLLHEGSFAYEDSTGATGTMHQGDVEWMQAGNGVWHAGHGIGKRLKGYQLWVALPPALENSQPLSRYLSEASFPQQGPARVILGELGGTRSPIASPSSMNYLDVRLKAGEVWCYEPPQGHDVAWIAVYEGNALIPEAISSGELAVFEEAQTSITFQADGNTSFVLGSAVKHPHDLVLGHYSVHTNGAALVQGEANIRRIAADLSRAGKL